MLELECAHASKQWLASKCLLEEWQCLIDSLQNNQQRLILKQEAGLHKGETLPVQQQLLVHTSERTLIAQRNKLIAAWQSVLDVESDEHSSAENEDNNASQYDRIQLRDLQPLVQLLYGIQEGLLKSGRFQWQKRR